LVEKRLKDKGGGDLINNPTVLLAGVTGLIQDLVGFVRSQSLVPQVDGQAGELAQLGCEGLRFCGLRASFAGKADRVAHDDRRNLEFTREPAEGTEILAWIAFSFERKDRLGR
jgi:hypothetical protein